MQHQLDMRRAQYKNAKMRLASVNRLKSDIPTVKSSVIADLNRKRGALQREIKRVSLLLWPDTGRPYTGNYVAINKITLITYYEGTYAQCREFIDEFCSIPAEFSVMKEDVFV